MPEKDKKSPGGWAGLLSWAVMEELRTVLWLVVHLTLAAGREERLPGVRQQGAHLQDRLAWRKVLQGGVDLRGRRRPEQMKVSHSQGLGPASQGWILVGSFYLSHAVFY